MACVLVEEEVVAVMEPEAVFWAFAEKEVNTLSLASSALQQ
jgi:hypothetical protein